MSEVADSGADPDTAHDDPGTADDPSAEDDAPLGQGIVRATVAGTALFTVLAVAAAERPDPLGTAAAAVDIDLFAVGCVAFLWAFGLAVSRSRTEEISVAGVYFLSGGSGPSAVRRVLLGAVAVEVVVALATAGARPFTNLAFGILVPVFGLGMTGVWTGRHGRFPPRIDEAQRRARRAPGAAGTSQ